MSTKYVGISLSALADDLNISYQTQSSVRIIYWKNKRSEMFEGEIVELLPNEQAIKIKSKDNVTKLKLRHIIKIYI